jgi:lysyl-tRNA synthetase class 2
MSTADGVPDSGNRHSGNPDSDNESNDASESSPGWIAAERERRFAQLEDLRKRGVEPYPYRFDRSHSLTEVRLLHADLEPGVETDHDVTVAGRVMLIRRQGKLIFATLRDRDGDIQLFVSLAVIGADAFEEFASLDLGDWVGVAGTVMTTRKGELSVKVSEFSLLAKAIRPLPDKWKGLNDVDTRYRQRYVDLVVNAEARRVFQVRHATIASIRRTMGEHGFIEVEGPILQTEAGGAHARPFVTRHNTLDLDMYLRIALELHLKRLIVGGFERVFEIGRVFRNEGISTRHNPEFTMMESYQAYGDVYDVMDLTEIIVANASTDALGTTVITIDDMTVDLGKPFRRARMLDLIEENTGERVHPSMSADEMRVVAERFDVRPLPHWGAGKIIAELYEATCEHTLIEPTFVYGYPVEVSPLARADRDDPFVTERFELIVGKRELANAYSELNDPVVQRQRFEDEQRAKEAGDAESGSVDEDYLRALEYGMPPTAGLGIGVDRLVMLLAGVASIKEVILFPTLRPESL